MGMECRLGLEVEEFRVVLVRRDGFVGRINEYTRVIGFHELTHYIRDIV